VNQLSRDGWHGIVWAKRGDAGSDHDARVDRHSRREGPGLSGKNATIAVSDFFTHQPRRAAARRVGACAKDRGRWARRHSLTGTLPTRSHSMTAAASNRNVALAHASDFFYLAADSRGMKRCEARLGIFAAFAIATPRPLRISGGPPLHRDGPLDGAGGGHRTFFSPSPAGGGPRANVGAEEFSGQASSMAGFRGPARLLAWTGGEGCSLFSKGWKGDRQRGGDRSTTFGGTRQRPIQSKQFRFRIRPSGCSKKTSGQYSRQGIFCIAILGSMPVSRPLCTESTRFAFSLEHWRSTSRRVRTPSLLHHVGDSSDPSPMGRFFGGRPDIGRLAARTDGHCPRADAPSDPPLFSNRQRQTHTGRRIQLAVASIGGRRTDSSLVLSLVG